MNDDVRISAAAKEAVEEFLRRLTSWYDYEASQADKFPAAELPEDEQAYIDEVGQEMVQRSHEGYARVCATYLLLGVESPWTPAPVITRADIADQLYPLFNGGWQVPTWREIEDRVRRLLADRLADFRTRVELHFARFLQRFKVDADYRLPRNRTFSSPGVGVSNVSMDWAERDRLSSAVQLVIQARTTPSAHADYARWIAGVVGACLMVVADENRSAYSAKHWFGACSPLDPARAVDNGMFRFSDVPLWADDLARFFELVSIAMHPSIAKDEYRRLNPESVFKSGIWTLADSASTPLVRGALAGYLGVFHSCVCVLYEPAQNWEGAADHCLRVLKLQGRNVQRALGRLFGIRNAALHELDPRFVSLHVFVAWQLARAALHALAGKVVPLAPTKRAKSVTTGPQRAKTRRPEPTFADRVGEILRVGGVQADWVFQDFA